PGPPPNQKAGPAFFLNGPTQKGCVTTQHPFSPGDFAPPPPHNTTRRVTGEFGRTPKINSRDAEGGRDHYPRCMFMLMDGGGVKGGQVLGESDETASAPETDGISLDDVAATSYHTLGIDHTKEYHTNTGRPITIVRDGHVIEKLLA